MRRYDRTQVLGIGKFYGTSNIIPIIRNNISNGTIRFKQRILKENERLDIIAGTEYGDSSLHWVIAAASGIGFCLQCPPGTILKIPILSDIQKFLN